MTKKTTVEKKVISFIREHDLIPFGEKLVAGVSGGADSVCLLHILRQQTDLGVRLHVAHLNHQLRGAQSDADAEYVSGLAHRLGLPVIIGRENVEAYRLKKPCSLEEAAREVRYEFLARVAKEIGATRVAVGHTRDDHIETILMHLIRGAGIAGLRGLEPRSKMVIGREELEVIRPLLTITRQETVDYCAKHQLMPQEDSSNLLLAFFRNRIRLELLPSLRKYNPNFDEALLRLAKIAKDEDSFLQEQARRLWAGVAREEGEVICLNTAEIAALPRALQRQLFRLAISQLFGDVRDIEAEHIEAMVSLVTKPSGKTLNLPRGLVFSSEYGQLILRPADSAFSSYPPLEGEFQLNIPGETIVSGWRVVATIGEGGFVGGEDSSVAHFDLNKTGRLLLVRGRKLGDRFQPLGMNEAKKLQDFMVDAKIPRSWRDRIPLVCSPGQILWVVGWRIDDRVKVTELTKEVLRLQFERL